jgi:hypothetical protein
VFKGIFTNWMFVTIILFIAGIQALIVEVGGEAMKTTGLNGTQWGFSLLIGAGSLVWGFILRFVPSPQILCCKIKVSKL